MKLHIDILLELLTLKEYQEMIEKSSSAVTYYVILEKHYFVKTIPESKIDLDKIQSQLAIQQKFGDEMIAQILIVFPYISYHHLVYEYRIHEDLEKFCNNNEIGDIQMRRILKQLFTFLSVLHLCGYSHNDFKASNIMVENANLDISLIDLDTLSKDSNTPPKMLTPRHLEIESIGKENYKNARRDVDSIIFSIYKIAENQIKSISGGAAQSGNQTISILKYGSQAVNYSKKKGRKMKIFGGSKLRIEENSRFNNDFSELLVNAESMTAFQILTDKYLTEGKNKVQYLKEIISEYKNEEILRTLNIYLTNFQSEQKKAQNKNRQFVSNPMIISNRVNQPVHGGSKNTQTQRQVKVKKKDER
eukprot:403374994